MGMPQFPDIKNRPSLKETIVDLLESIAVEETAIANVIRAEAKKIYAFLGKKGDFPTHPTNEDIVDFNQGVSRILETILMKEWILLKKLETVISIETRFNDDDTAHKGKSSPGSSGPAERKRFEGIIDWYDEDENDAQSEE